MLLPSLFSITNIVDKATHLERAPLHPCSGTFVFTFCVSLLGTSFQLQGPLCHFESEGMWTR